MTIKMIEKPTKKNLQLTCPNPDCGTPIIRVIPINDHKFVDTCGNCGAKFEWIDDGKGKEVS